MSKNVPVFRAAFVAAVFAASPAFAAKEFGTGNITAVDWNVMQVEIKTPKGGRLTYKVAPNVEVKFTDRAADFPNPTYKDLTAPMYIHFAFEDQTMSSVDVREVGSAPGRAAQKPAATASTSSSRVLKIRISKIDNDSIDADVAGRKQTFRLDNRNLIRGFRENDLAVATVVRRNNRDVITDLKPSN